MSDEQDKLKLSLEPPKLFGRKKKSDATGTSKSTSPAPAEQPSVAPVPPADAETEVLDEQTEVVDEPTEVIEEPIEPEPVAEEPVAEVPAAEQEPGPEPVAKKAAPVKKATPAKKAAPVKKAAPAAKPAAATKPAAASAQPAEETVPAKKPARPRAKLAPEIEPEPITAAHHDDDITEVEEEGPLLPIYPAAAVTGALAGVTMVVLTWLSLRGCESIRGTASCGGGPGFLLLIATFVVCILLGSTLLKVFQIPDPGSSSFLGVGLVAVVSLLFLIDVLDHWSMLIVIPIISVGAFLASVWVTKTFVEPGEA